MSHSDVVQPKTKRHTVMWCFLHQMAHTVWVIQFSILAWTETVLAGLAFCSISLSNAPKHQSSFCTRSLYEPGFRPEWLQIKSVLECGVFCLPYFDAIINNSSRNIKTLVWIFISQDDRSFSISAIRIKTFDIGSECTVISRKFKATFDWLTCYFQWDTCWSKMNICNGF